MGTKQIFLFLIWLFFIQANVLGFDNRFIPKQPHYLILPNKTKSFFAFDALLGFAEDAYTTGDREIGLFEMTGQLDLGVLGRSIEKATKKNPLRSYFQDKTI